MVTPLSSGTTIQIDTHSLARDGSILKVSARGQLTFEQNIQVLSHYEAILDEQGYVLIVLDVEEARGIDMHARKASAEWGKAYVDRCRCAVVGAPFFVRVVLEMMNRATNVLARSTKRVLVGFFATEEEAREWLLAQVPSLEQSADEGVVIGK